MSEQNRTALGCRNITKTFPGRPVPITVLQDISFEIAQGEFVCIVGPSGCGKSTLLKLIAGLIDLTSGQLTLSDVQDTSRPHSAMVFQEHGLFPWMTVLDNVAFGLEMQGAPANERRERAQAFLGQIGLAHFSLHYPHELSVGMRQRTAIARAFLTDPELLLMDEPFSSLDAQSKLILQEELLRIWKDHRKTVVFVTHDIDEAVMLADRVLVMSGHPGHILEEIRVPLARPRDLRDRDQPQIREIAWHIWKAIEEQVRQSLSLPASGYASPVAGS